MTPLKDTPDLSEHHYDYVRVGYSDLNSDATKPYSAQGLASERSGATESTDRTLSDRTLSAVDVLTENRLASESHEVRRKLPRELQEGIKAGYKDFLKREYNDHHEPLESLVVEKSFELYEKWGCGDLYSIINIIGALYEAGFRDVDKLSPKDIWLHRCNQKKYVDLKTKKIGNNPCAVAMIRDNKCNGFRSFKGKIKLNYDTVRLNQNRENYLHCPETRIALPYGGINLFVSTSKKFDIPFERYGTGEEKILLRINLADAFDQNATVYRDMKCPFEGAVILALPIGEKVSFTVSKMSSGKPFLIV